MPVRRLRKAVTAARPASVCSHNVKVVPLCGLRGRIETMKQTLLVMGALLIGICIGVVGPNLFTHHVDTSWKALLTEPQHFGVGYAADVAFSDIPTPDINSFTGRAKFLEAVGPRQQTQFGYVININMGALDLARVPQRYKESKKEMINGYEVTAEPIKQASYEIQFEFVLIDADGFVLKTLHGESLPALMSGTENLFQAMAAESVDYATAVKVHEIWVHPSLTKCYSCLPAN